MSDTSYPYQLKKIMEYFILGAHARLKWKTPFYYWRSISGLRKVYNWETTTYGKIWDNEDMHDLGSVETEFSAIVFKDTLTSEATLSCEPMVSSLNNDEIDLEYHLTNPTMKIA
ncbi:hypothetical protein Tco_0099756 [Tanacetum coccineum]